MILHGDELGRTQEGNNNVYCQDNELAWVDWDLEDSQQDLLDFTSTLVALRRDHPVFRRRRFFAGDADHGGQSDLGDIVWYGPTGVEMDHEAWHNSHTSSLMVFLNGEAIPTMDARGRPVVDDHFLLLFNAWHEQVDFTIPGGIDAREWSIVFDTSRTLSEDEEQWQTGSTNTLQARSAVVLMGTPTQQD